MSFQQEPNKLVMFTEYNIYSEPLFEQNEADNNDSQISDD